jgi:hypothetical protein
MYQYLVPQLDLPRKFSLRQGLTSFTRAKELRLRPSPTYLEEGLPTCAFVKSQSDRKYRL